MVRLRDCCEQNLPTMINLQNRLDDIKCYEPIRQLRWPDGARCRHCGAAMITKPGRDNPQPARQKDRCAGCHRCLDDLAGTGWTGHHQPLRVLILCWYFMGLNLSNAQIAQGLGLNLDDVQRMTEPLCAGIVAHPHEPVLAGEVECDEVSVVAGHQGRRGAVKKGSERPTAASERSAALWRAKSRRSSA